MSAWADEVKEAQRTGQCIGCGADTKWYQFKERYTVMCGSKQCRAVYMMLYYESVLRAKR